MIHRIMYKANTLRRYAGQDLAETSSPEDANLRSSEVGAMSLANTFVRILKKDLHAPALDIDGIHCELKESSTPGNFHLYIDKPMPWSDYAKLLKTLYEVGIIEEAFYAMCIRDGASFLRTKHKEQDPEV